MALWKFAKSLRSSRLESKVLSGNNFAHALTPQLVGQQLMRNNKSFMTGIIPFSHISLSVTEPTRFPGREFRDGNLKFSHQYALFSTGSCFHQSRGVNNFNGLLLISKVGNCSRSDTCYSDTTRMFSSTQNVAAESNSSAQTEKKDAGKTSAEQNANSDNTDSKTKTETTNKDVSKKGMLKQAIKDYGSTVIVFHIAMSLCSLGIFYVLVSSGLDMVELLKKLGVGESILQSKITQGASTFVIAYAVHKVFAPVRITITLTATPLIVRKLRAVGFLKKPIQK